jgi:DNA-binding NarL/FixJ family response regulator
MPEQGIAEVTRSLGRSLCMAWSDLFVRVVASGALRERIVGTLEAGSVAVLNGDSGAAPDIRVIAVDLAQPTSVKRLQAMLSQAGPGPVVVISPECGSLGARRAVRAGAQSLVLEDQLEAALVPAVRAVAAGLSVVPAVLRNGGDSLMFSHREREVLGLAISGHTNSEIATTLFLAESTVKSHLSSAYRKLGAASRKDAASLLLDPDEGLGEMVLGGRS